MEGAGFKLDGSSWEPGSEDSRCFAEPLMRKNETGGMLLPDVADLANSSGLALGLYIYSPKPADGAKLEKMVEELVEKKMKEKKAEEEKRSQHKWRVASTAVRASVRLQGGAPQYEALDSAQSQSQHTGLTLDFSDFGVDDE